MSDSALTTLLESILAQVSEVRADVSAIRSKQAAIEQQLADHIESADHVTAAKPDKYAWLSSVKYLAPALAVVFLAGMNTSDRLRSVPATVPATKQDSLVLDHRKQQEELIKKALGEIK